ncbi:sulfotransferase [Stieleria sp. TO1_6]|uniref:sulfotransferase n=1 Tax=Stieleria tagensis TaxID=2956795 RepID=UPI00209B77DC|nr:sulfotransferase [Stieleria tagensis]MCO8121414.1 sulfotransferase [Stieleria tagensis]
MAETRKPIPTQFDGVSPDPVLVMGMHNSGSTALSRCLHACGLFMVNNATQCESHFFSNYVNDELLMGGGSNWANYPILSVEQVMSYRDTVGQFMLDQWRIDLMQWGYDGTSPWGIKDARTCVLLPLYLDVFPNSKILFIRRDPDDIAASLSHREKPGVGVHKDPDHWKRLTLAHFERVETFGKAHRWFHEVGYEELCCEPVETGRRIHEYLELPYTVADQQVYQRTMHRDRLGTRAWTGFKWRVMAIKKGLQVMLE